MSKYACPNGHEITQGVVCGGDGPHYNHWAGDEPIEEATAPNVYFMMDLKTGKMTKELVSDLPFALTDQDWKEMHEHCKGGCCSEPQCPVCSEYLEVAG